MTTKATTNKKIPSVQFMAKLTESFCSVVFPIRKDNPNMKPNTTIKFNIRNLLTYKRTSLPSTKGQSLSLLGKHATLIERACSAIVGYVVWMLGSLPTICHRTGTGKQSATARGCYNYRNDARNWSTPCVGRSYQRGESEQRNHYKLFHFVLLIKPLINALADGFFLATLAFWALVSHTVMRMYFSIGTLLTDNLSSLYTTLALASIGYQHTQIYGSN